MTGALLALSSAALFGLNSASIRRGVLTGSVLHALAITVPLGIPMFALAYLVSTGFTLPATLLMPGWAWFALAGIVHFALGRYGNYRATRAIGSTLSAPLQQISIPVSLALAIVFLDERLTILRAAGILLVVIGPVIATWQKQGQRIVETSSGFRPAYREGFFWGTFGATAYGLSPLFIMKGLGEQGGLSTALAGGLISYIAAGAFILGLVFFAGGMSFMRQLDRVAGKWFLLSSVLVFLSQVCRYTALALAPVSVVVPIQRMSIIFRVIFSWLINREHEIFGAKLYAGVLISLVGTIALSLSTEFVQSLLPDAWSNVLASEWP